jgi:diphthamide synthase (EF-2-diphthine--ammonia ligase)
MSTIGRFLQAKEPLFDHALHQLELRSRQKGIDVKLAAEIAETAADRYLYHFREALWNEVFARYMGEKVLEEQLLEKLDNAVIKPEVLTRRG